MPTSRIYEFVQPMCTLCLNGEEFGKLSFPKTKISSVIENYHYKLHAMYFYLLFASLATLILAMRNNTRMYSK